MTKVTDEQLKSYLKQKGYELQALKEEAKRITFPENIDVVAFIQQRITEITEQIPDELEHKPIILKYLRCALKAYNRGDDDAFRLDLLRAEKNTDNALSDRWTLGVTKQYGRNAEESKKAKQEQRKPAWDLWQEIADKMVSDMRASNPSKVPSKRELAIKIESRLRENRSQHAASFETIKKRIVIHG